MFFGKLDTANIEPHRAVVHLLSAYHVELLKHAPVNLKEVKTMYVQTHTLPSFPTLTAPSTTLPPTITPIFSQMVTQHITQEEAVKIPNLDLIYRNPCSFFTV